MHRPVSVGFTVFVVVVVVLGPIAPVAGAVDAPSDPRPAAAGAGLLAPSIQDDVDSGDFDTTTFEITVHENGSATWTFRHEQRLDGGEDADATDERANFEAFAERFESEETGMYERFTDQARAMTEVVDTDREMEATDFNRSARVAGQFNPVGIVEMSFRWRGFAETDDGRVVVGDVFENIYLTEGQSIVVEPGGDLEFRRAEPEPVYVGSSLQDASSVQWRGERDFLDGRPRVVLERSDGAAAGDGPLSSDAAAVGDTSVPWSVAFLVLGVAFAAAALVWHRRSDGDQPATESGSPPGDSTSDRETRPDVGSAPAAPSAPDSDPLADDELLTDEDRVVALIRDNGGRMKQVNIVDETGWSKSKVSMLLSEMEDEGTISKLRVGRENIISLEGFEPEATKSPFED